MVNSTLQEAVPHKKVKYTTIPAEQIDKLMSPDYVLSEKIDGAAAFVKLMKNKIHVLSYRGQKDTGKPIIHTYRLGLGHEKLEIPKELQGRILRGEIWGEREGRAIPFQELGGLLNAATAKSIRKQMSTNTRLRMALFGVKSPDQDLDYQATQKIIDDALKVLPSGVFHKPLHAYSEADKRKLFEDIREGRNPRTVEGVVGHPVAGGRPAKVKFTKEYDVYVRNVFPGEHKYRGSAAGGFSYSMTPKGPIIGKVGTGISDDLRRSLWSTPDQYVGRVARVRAQEQFPSGALRAPSLLGLHEDYPLAKTADSNSSTVKLYSDNVTLLTEASPLMIKRSQPQSQQLWAMPKRQAPSMMGTMYPGWPYASDGQPMYLPRPQPFPYLTPHAFLPTTTLSRTLRGGGSIASTIEKYTGSKFMGRLSNLAAFQGRNRMAAAIERIQANPFVRQQIESEIPKAVVGTARTEALRKAYIQRMLPELLMSMIPRRYFQPYGIR